MIGDPHHPLSPYQGAASRLEAITRLKPLPIYHEWDRDERGQVKYPGRPDVITVRPSGGFGGAGPLAYIVGIRLFHIPRDIQIHALRIRNTNILDCGVPFDAACYAMENPLPPLADPNGMGPGYRGEPLRFIAVDWGMITYIDPLEIEARPVSTPSTPWPLAGYLVVSQSADPSPSFRQGPFGPHGLDPLHDKGLR